MANLDLTWKARYSFALILSVALVSHTYDLATRINWGELKIKKNTVTNNRMLMRLRSLRLNGFLATAHSLQPEEEVEEEAAEGVAPDELLPLPLVTLTFICG